MYNDKAIYQIKEEEELINTYTQIYVVLNIAGLGIHDAHFLVNLQDEYIQKDIWLLFFKQFFFNLIFFFIPH